MPRYVVGFEVADARNLVTEDGQPCNPFVVVQCCGKTYTTATKEQKSQHVSFAEDNIWADIELQPEEFESAYIDFTVYAKNWFVRNYCIGQASLQLTSINRRKGHAFVKKSLPLRQPGGIETTGTITITVWCLQPGQSAPSHAGNSLEEATKSRSAQDFDDLSKDILGTVEATEQTRPFNIHLNIYRVENLAKLGYNFPNPFVTVEFAGACVKTTVAYDVEHYTWNECARIPVHQPFFEDTILIKLWSRGSAQTLWADELLAQGLISFTELRNNPLPAKWFPLYGWDVEEIPDVEEIAKRGENVRPNFFKGTLLISGNVLRLEEDEELQPAGIMIARPAAEPIMTQCSLLADVHEVCGAIGNECQVQLAFGKQHKETKEWVTPSQELSRAEKVSRLHARYDISFGNEDEPAGQVEGVVTFKFSQAQGRIDPLLVMAPTETDSQPWVMVNVYTRGALSGSLRVAYQMRRIEDFPWHEPGNPSRPRFMAMEAMPECMGQRTPVSVLIAIERFSTDDVARPSRKNVKPMAHILRAYIFMARNIATESTMNYTVRIGCAGISRSTESLQDIRPMWMVPLELKLSLCSDTSRGQPTMEPITVVLYDDGGLVKGETEIGKTVCAYEYMRQKDDMGTWEPYKLKPQWIQLKGGPYGNAVTGEILIAFELLHAKFRDETELLPRAMWPVEQHHFDPRKHFSVLRKATLHFALYGLRDLVLRNGDQQQAGSNKKDGRLEPLVLVQVKNFSHEAHSSKDDKFFTLTFEYKAVKEGGDRANKEDRLQKWQSDALGVKGCWNYEFLQVQKIPIWLPSNPVLEPFIVVSVYERPKALFGITMYERGENVGEYRESMNKLFPCTWFQGVDVDRPYEEQVELIQEGVRRGEQEARARAEFTEMPAEERVKEVRAERERRRKEEIRQEEIRQEEIRQEEIRQEKRKLEEKGKLEESRSILAIEGQEEPNMALNSAGLPHQLRPYHATNPGGYLEREFVVKDINHLNMKKMKSFKDRYGEKPCDDSLVPGAHLQLEGNLETSKQKHIFSPDFWFQKRPLLKHHDNIDPADSQVDWNFQYQKCYGFVKFALKLTDGWEKSAEDDSDGDDQEAQHSARGSKYRRTSSMSSIQSWLWDTAKQGAGKQEEDDDAQAAGKEIVHMTSATQAQLCNTEHSAEKLRRTFGIDDALNLYISDTATFVEQFKHREQVPSRIRVRIYFVKGVCIYGKSDGLFSRGLVDPYLAFVLGRQQTSMRNMAAFGTNMPTFYRAEERDIDFPQEARLEVNMYNYNDSIIVNEALIGSTVIDLEDRWHSAAWQRANQRQQLPIEHRPLYNPGATAAGGELEGQENCGTLEMWVEMIDSVLASDRKAAELRKPPAIEIEIRLVIRSTTDVKIVDGNHTDVKVSVDLECQEYSGASYGYPKNQTTDTHAGSTTGNATFNYRIVFPRIVMPTKSCTMAINVWDNNLVVGDTFIGSVNIDLKRYVEKVARDMDQIYIENANLRISAASGNQDEEDENIGQVQFEMWVMTQSEAAQKPAGMARDEPNDNPPLLMPTEGRGWGDLAVGWEFELPQFPLLKKALPVIVVFFTILVVLRLLNLL